MKTLETKRRPVGRPPAYRRPVLVRIKEDVLQRLGPTAPAIIRELVENTFGVDSVKGKK